MMHRIHPIAGLLAAMLVLTFWLSTAWSELFGSAAQVIWVKTLIPWGLLILIPALAATGGSGFTLAKTHTNPLIAAKRRRMPIIAITGVVVLVPSALFLAWKAGRGELDTVFYAVQALELAAGALNLTLLGLNIRDGLRASGRVGEGRAARTIEPA